MTNRPDSHLKNEELFSFVAIRFTYDRHVFSRKLWECVRVPVSLWCGSAGEKAMRGRIALQKDFVRNHLRDSELLPAPSLVP